MAINQVSRRRSITILWLSGFLVLLLCLTWLLDWSESTRKVDRLLHDSWVRIHQRQAPDDIVIAAIDTKSLQALGRWPWPRNLQALMFEQLKRKGAAAAVIDILYTEASDSTANDAKLARAIGDMSLSILPVLTEGRSGTGDGVTLPLPNLSRTVTDLGHIFLPIDDDGIVRRVNLKSGFNRAHWSALSLAAMQAIEPDRQYDEDHLPGRRLGEPATAHLWVQDHEVYIPFYGTSGTFNRVSAIDLVRGDVPADAIAGKIVFVGLTTTGLGDVVPTPVSALDQPLPGIEIHANIFAGLRDGSLVTRIHPYSNLLVALALLPFMLLVYSRAPPQWSLFGALIGAGAPVVLSFFLYRYGRLWYPPLAASLPILISYLFWSRHRLDFVNRFIEREQSKLEPHIPQRDSRSNNLLAEFFGHANRHLPIQGWRFSAKGETFEGGSGLPSYRVKGGETTWRHHGDVYAKEFPTPGNLHIELSIPDAQLGQEIIHYVDTLARVQSRHLPGPLTGSIERLQNNARRLSEQMEWMRSVKVFSENILEGSPIGFAVWNPAGEQVRGNELLIEMVPDFKGSSELCDFLEAVGRHPEQGEDEAQLKRLLLQGEPWQVIHIDSKSERELIVNFSAVGDPLSHRLICASVIDVSDIRSAERARAEMVDYLSHDLRSPLISALYLLEDEALGDNVDIETTARIENNIHHSLRMMDDLLSVARADSLTEDSFSELLFNSVLDNVLDQLIPQARNAQVHFELETADADLWMDGDAASLERAVSNIVGNAIKYSPVESRIFIELAEDNGYALLVVTDEGIGIDPAMADQLFTRFKRDSKVADQFKGIGLGLALVSRVVRQHHGTVKASSVENGTRITMRLPIKKLND